MPTLRRPDRKLTSPPSVPLIALLAALASSFVFLFAVVLQWAIYDDWLHRSGPVRLVGTSIATVLTFAFVCWWMLAQRAQQAELLRRFEVIAEMNDRIRNAAQALALTNYAYQPEKAEAVRQAVEAIDQALRGVIETVAPPKALPQSERPRATAQRSKG